MHIHVGTSGYSYPEWKGSFYPAKFPTKQMLSYYAARLGTVEINNTFYQPPTVELLANWAEQVPTGFRFVLKAPQLITHRRRLVNVAEPWTQLLTVAHTLGARLGPILVQLPPNLKCDLPRLHAFLDLVPATVRVVMEFRHASWFTDAVFAGLRERRVGLCWADVDEELVVPQAATTNWGYLRLRRRDYPPAVLQTWVECIYRQAWDECFVFFKHEDAGTGPMLATHLRALLAQRPQAA